MQLLDAVDSRSFRQEREEREKKTQVIIITIVIGIDIDIIGDTTIISVAGRERNRGQYREERELVAMQLLARCVGARNRIKLRCFCLMRL